MPGSTTLPETLSRAVTRTGGPARTPLRRSTRLLEAGQVIASPESRLEYLSLIHI